MTEQNAVADFRIYRHIPEGSLWMDAPTVWRNISASDWQQSATVIRGLMDLGEDVGNEGLTIALGDAQTRCNAEAERARERESSEKDEGGYSPAEHERVVGLIRRTDTLNNARFMIEDHVPEKFRSTVLPELEELYDEAYRELNRYKRDIQEALA